MIFLSIIAFCRGGCRLNDFRLEETFSTLGNFINEIEGAHIYGEIKSGKTFRLWRILQIGDHFTLFPAKSNNPQKVPSAVILPMYWKLNILYFFFRFPWKPPGLDHSGLRISSPCQDLRKLCKNLEEVITVPFPLVWKTMNFYRWAEWSKIY